MSKLGALLQLALVMSSVWLAAADSTIQNVSTSRLIVNGRLLIPGQILTVGIADGRSTTTIDLSFVRAVTNLQIRNSREYFIVDNQSGSTGSLGGRMVRTLDLVEGKTIESDF